MAGEAAEAKILGRALVSDVTKICDAVQSLRLGETLPRSDIDNIARTLAAEKECDDQLAQDLLTRRTHAIQRLLDRDDIWARVAAVAAALIDQGELSGPEVEACRRRRSAAIAAPVQRGCRPTRIRPSEAPMPVPHHDDLEFVAGDDWDIGATLLRPDGTAYDLSNASVIWMLRGPDGIPVFQPGQYAINLTPPLTAGMLVIAVPAAVTAALRPGRYLDSLRATDSAGTDIFWTGMILVSPNPWGE